MTFAKGTNGMQGAPRTKAEPIAPVRGRLFRARAAAEYLGISESRVRTLLATGDLVALRSAKGRVMGIYERDCDAWIAKHQQAAEPTRAPQTGDEQIDHLLPAERWYA